MNFKKLYKVSKHRVDALGRSSVIDSEDEFRDKDSAREYISKHYSLYSNSSEELYASIESYVVEVDDQGMPVRQYHEYIKGER